MKGETFAGRVEAGTVTLRRPERFRAYLRELRDGDIEVTVARPKKPASQSQKGYYFAAVIPTIAEDVGYTTKKEAHNGVAMLFLRIEDDPITKTPRRRSISSLDHQEMSDYLTQVITWAETDMNIRIPPPNGPLTED